VLASRLYTELRASDEWQTVNHAFEFRNIVSALAFLDQDEANRSQPVALGPARLSSFAEEIRVRLGQATHREDLGSSIALAETLVYLDEESSLRPGDADWMNEEALRRPFDIRIQIRAVLTLGRREDAASFLGDVANELNTHVHELRSPAPVVRVLDAIAKLDQAALLPGDPENACKVAEQICDALDRFQPLPDRGWLSLEATADITRGLIALYRHVPPDEASVIERILAHVATGANALRPACDREIRGPKAVARLARLVHAVIAAERHFPIGLQRLATLEWPHKPPQGGGETAQRSRLEQLAIRNDELQDSAHTLTARLEAQQQQLAEQRVPVRVGRGLATLLPALGLLAVCTWVVIAVGSVSWQGVLLNVGVIFGALAVIAGGLFSLLKRANLLAAPAEHVLNWLSPVSSFVSSVGKLKRQ
jgi:hypothetical protein